MKKPCWRRFAMPTIAGAGLDVFEQEPLPSDSPLVDMPNVLSPEQRQEQIPITNSGGELLSHNLRRYLRGEPLRNQVDPHKGY